MKTLWKLSLYFSFALLIGLAGCGDDDDDDNDDNNDDSVSDCDSFPMLLEDEAENIEQAFTDLLNDASTANCEAFLDAFDDYVELIEDGRSCLSTADQQELDEAIAAFEELRDDPSVCDN